MKSNKNIIKSYREYLEHSDIPLSQALKQINKRFGTRITTSHFGEMQKGLRSVRDDVFRYIVNEVYEFSVIQCGIKRIELANIKYYNELISMPVRKR